MKSCCTAQALAHYVVNQCYEDGFPISNLQLQKILYFLQVIYAKSTSGKAVLFLDNFYAWPYGPVLPGVYDEFSSYGGRVIETRFDEAEPCSETIMSFVKQGVIVLRERSPWDLVELSHAKGSPWDRVYRGGEGYKCMIPLDYILEEAKA